MCKFFSLVSNGRGRIFYLNHNQRQEIKSSDLQPDSHTSIVSYYRNKGKLADNPKTEDKLNKWEYNPLIKLLTCDTLNTKDDTDNIQKFCDSLDFKTIVPELFIKSIVLPFKISKQKVNEKEILLLKQWDSVWDSVRDSVWDSVGGYTSSFFELDNWKYIDHKKGVNPFQPCIDLWGSGFVPSFDGKKWRLHAGEKAEIVFEISKEYLITYKGDLK